jgi:hypothetical protein
LIIWKNHDKPLEQRQKTVSKINWNRIDKNLYQQEIEKQLDNLSIDNYAEIHLDKACYDINSLIESAVLTVAPSNKITDSDLKQDYEDCQFSQCPLTDLWMKLEI